MFATHQFQERSKLFIQSSHSSYGIISSYVGLNYTGAKWDIAKLQSIAFVI